MAVNLDILIRAIDRASGPLNKIEDNLDDLDRAGDRTTRRMGGLRTALGTGLKIAGGAAALGIGALAFAFRDTISLAREQINVEKQLDAVLASTQGAAGLTAQEIKNMASELQGVTNFGDEAILSGQNLLLTFTNIGKDVFPQATETMLNMSQAMGQDMKTSAIQLGKALNDPTAGLSALSRVGITFTEQQKEQIKALQESGDIMGAQTIILKELERQFGGSARAMADPAIQLRNAWGDFKEEVGRFIIPLLNDLAQRALPVLINAMIWFNDRGIPAMEQFGRTVTSVVDTIRTVFGWLRQSVDNDVTGRFAYLKAWADTNFPLLRQLVENIVGALTTFWRNHGETIMYLVRNTLQTVMVIFDTTLRTILGLVQFVLQVLTGDWQGAGQTLISIVQNIWSGITQIFQIQIDTIRAIFAQHDWASIGSAIVQGIANGIAGGAQWIIDAARDAARRALEEAKRWLGIRSPSKEAEKEIGRPFVQGIALGIDRELSALTNGLNGGLSNMMAGMVPAPVQAGAGSLNITVNLSGPATYGAGRDVGRGISDELRARGLR